MCISTLAPRTYTCPSILRMCHLLGFAPLRVALLALVITALGGCWFIEQPASSLLKWHPRIRWLFRACGKVFGQQTVREHFCTQLFTSISILCTDHLLLSTMIVHPRFFPLRGSWGTMELPPRSSTWATATAPTLAS